MTISSWVLLRMRNVSNKSCRENQNTHFMFGIFFFENRAVCEIMSKNMVKPERTQTIWRLLVAYWVSKPTRTQAQARACVPTPQTAPPTHTHTDARTNSHALTNARDTHTEICNIYCFSTAAVVPRTRLNGTRILHVLSVYASPPPFPRLNQ